MLVMSECPHDYFCDSADSDEIGEGAGMKKGLHQVCFGHFEFSSHWDSKGEVSPGTAPTGLPAPSPVPVAIKAKPLGAAHSAHLRK